MMTRDAVYENACAVRIPSAGQNLSFLFTRMHSGWKTVCLWRHRARQRRQLLRLDARMLSDIGIKTDAQRHEGLKPFWQN